MNTKLLLVLFTIGLLAGCGKVPPSTRGVEVGSGGEECAQDFVRTGNELVGELNMEPIEDVDTALLSKALKNTKVICLPSVTLNGNEVDAANYPSARPSRIEVNETRWAKADSFNKAFLVLHEYLGIIGIEDKNYQISARLDRARICGRSQELKRAVEGALRKSCYRILPQDLKNVNVLDELRANLLKPGDFHSLSHLQTLRLTTDLMELPAGIFSDLLSQSSFFVFSLTGKTLKLREANLAGLMSQTRRLEMVRVELSVAEIDKGALEGILTPQSRINGLLISLKGEVQIKDGAFENLIPAGSKIQGLDIQISKDVAFVSPEIFRPLDEISDSTDLCLSVGNSRAWPWGIMEVFKKRTQLELKLETVHEQTLNEIEEAANLKTLWVQSPFDEKPIRSQTRVSAKYDCKHMAKISGTERPIFRYQCNRSAG